jgi:peroxiredoxin Q/BCP
MLTIGQAFPEFWLPGPDDKEHGLEEFRGHWLIVYFYPKDNSSGCSLEAQNFAALFNSFAERRAAIVGVSPDSCKSHGAFAAKFNLPFILLSDPQHILLRAAGVWQSKKMYGREYMGVARATVLVDGAGIVRHVWSKVKVAGHAQDVYAKLLQLAA